MAVNLDSLNYLEAPLPGIGWNPRPGLDLDAGIRLQRNGPLSQWQSVLPQVNQYDRFMNGFGFSGLVGTVDHRVFAIVDLFDNPQGPGWGMQPEDTEVMFPWNILNGLTKDQFEDANP